MRNYISAIFTKLDASDRDEVIARARAAGLGEMNHLRRLSLSKPQIEWFRDARWRSLLNHRGVPKRRGPQLYAG